MKISMLMVTLLAGGLLSAPVFANDNSQQSKMKSCNSAAAGKKGEDRKVFMKDCLSNTSKTESQQEKMKSCNAAALGKKGDERKAFMRECLTHHPT